MHSTIISTLALAFLLWATCTLSLPYSGTCDSCGKECQSACGTKGFRTCCLNYLKKRSISIPTGSEMRLELMMVLPELAQYYPSLRNLFPTAEEHENSKTYSEFKFLDLE